MAYFQKEAALEKGNVSFFFYLRIRRDSYLLRGDLHGVRISDRCLLFSIRYDILNHVDSHVHDHGNALEKNGV
jgi:hypothetical protein